MRHTLLEAEEGRRKFILVLDAGEEAITAIKVFARAQDLQGSSVTGIGAFKNCSFGHFDPALKEFTRNDFSVQAEVLALIGNIAGNAVPPDEPDDDDDGDAGPEDDGPHLHLHCVVGLHDATTRGGHLIQGIVSPTMELIIEESPTHMSRGFDHGSHLVLLQPNQKD
jgi:predicted DNA-binding protein with PD1-like motif